MLSDLYFFKSLFVISNENDYDLYYNITLIIVGNNTKLCILFVHITVQNSDDNIFGFIF
jgi:hypothetical protein